VQGSLDPLARFADPELRAALAEARESALALGVEPWIVGESALAARLALPTVRAHVALRAGSEQQARAADAAVRERLRRRPGRPLWLREAAAQELQPLIVARTAPAADLEFGRELEAAGHAPLVWGISLRDGRVFDPHAIEPSVAAGRLPGLRDARGPARLRCASLLAWSGLEAGQPIDAPCAESLAEAWCALTRRAGAAAALRALGQPRLAEWGLIDGADPDHEQRLALVQALGPRADAWAISAAWFDPRASELADPERWSDTRERLATCGLPGELRHALSTIWRLLERAQRLCERAGEVGFETLRQSERIRVVREAHWPRVHALLVARAALAGVSGEALREGAAALENFRTQFAPQELHPHPLLALGDLINARISRGEPSRELLEEALDLQLDGTLATREAAVSWLRARALDLALGDRAQLGGKMRRRKKANG
jgi:hypothetical protein